MMNFLKSMGGDNKMKIYCLIRKAEFDVDDTYLQIDCYSSLEKAEQALKEAYEDDTADGDSTTILESYMNPLDYYVELINENAYVGGCRIRCEIQSTELQ